MSKTTKLLATLVETSDLFVSYFKKIGNLLFFIASPVLFLFAHSIFRKIYWLGWILLYFVSLAILLLIKLDVLNVTNRSRLNSDLKILNERLYGFKLDSKLYSLLKQDFYFGRFPSAMFEELEKLQSQLNRDPISLTIRKLESGLTDMKTALNIYLKLSGDYLYTAGQNLEISDYARKVDLDEGKRQVKLLNDAGKEFTQSYERLFNLIHKQGGSTREKVFVL